MAVKISFHYKLYPHQQSEWVRFWEQCRNSYPRQHYLFGEVERAKGRTPIYVMGKVDGDIVCIAIFSIHPLFFGKRFSLEAYCLRGPAFDDVSFFKEFIQQVIARFKALGVAIVRVSPYWQFPEAEEVESVLNELRFVPYYKSEGSRSDTGFVDLRRPENEILVSFPRSVRYNVRRAEKLGVKVQAVTKIDEAYAAYECLSAMRSTRGLTPMSREEFTATFKHILKDREQGILLVASLNNELLGAFWLIRGPYIAYPIGYALNTENCRRLVRTLTVGHPLWWRGMKWAKENKCSWLDVEGYNENIEKSNPHYHIHEFKSHFRPKPVQIISEHICVCNALNYVVYKIDRSFLRGFKFVRSLPYQLRTRVFFPRDNRV